MSYKKVLTFSTREEASRFTSARDSTFEGQGVDRSAAIVQHRHGRIVGELDMKDGVPDRVCISDDTQTITVGEIPHCHMTTSVTT